MGCGTTTVARTWRALRARFNKEAGGLTFRLLMATILAALAIGWAVFMPLLMMLATHLDGVSDNVERQTIRD